MGAALFLGSHWHCPHTHDLCSSRRKMRTVLRVEQNAGGLELWNEKPLNRYLGGGWAMRCCLRWLLKSHTAHRDKTQICTFFPNDPIKSPILLSRIRQEDRKPEGQFWSWNLAPYESAIPDSANGVFTATD